MCESGMEYVMFRIFYGLSDSENDMVRYILLSVKHLVMSLPQ